MTFRVSPGVYPVIQDDSFQPSYTNPSIAAFVGGVQRGPLGPTFISSYNRRSLLYGNKNPSWSYVLDSVDAFLLQGNESWVNRVVASDARYSLGLIANNTIGGTPHGTSYNTLPCGSAVGYQDVNLDIHDIEVTGTILAGQTIAVTINGVTISTLFSGSHNTTLENFAVSIGDALITLGDGVTGRAFIVATGSSSQLIRVVSPEAITLDLTALTVTGTGTLPTVNSHETDWLCVTVADNPGAWASPGPNGPGVAVGISNVDEGTPQRITLSFSSSIVVGSSISLDINGTPISVPFSVNNNTTLTNVIGAYAAAFPGGSGNLISVAGDSHQIVLIAPNSNTTLAVTNFIVTVPSGGTYVETSWSITLTGTPSTGSFNFVVYENPYFASPDETYLCTYLPGTDGLGNPTGLEYVINDGPRASSRVNVLVNPVFSGVVYGPTGVTNSNSERYLGGGADGSLPTSAQVIEGWTSFSNPEAITIRILVNGGYSSPEVQQQMISIASSRMDCFAILDVPSDSQDPQSAANYRVNEMDIDSYWGAAYSPDILIYDSNMGVRRYIPPSGVIAGQYAYNDKVAQSWYSPAGLTRGIIEQGLGLRYVYEEGDRDLLSQSQVNAIRKYGSAWVIWGEYTLQQDMSALQSVGVVRMMIDVMTEAADACAYSVFEPNNRFTWNRTSTSVNAILGPVEAGQGITDYYVQCDGTNNTPDVIDERVMNVGMWIKPTLSALYIQLTGTVTRQSAVFALDMVAAINNL